VARSSRDRTNTPEPHAGTVDWALFGAESEERALLQVKINSKDFRPRRAERMAGNSGRSGPSAPNLVKRVAGKSVARRCPETGEDEQTETYSAFITFLSSSAIRI